MIHLRFDVPPVSSNPSFIIDSKENTESRARSRPSANAVGGDVPNPDPHGEPSGGVPRDNQVTLSVRPSEAMTALKPFPGHRSERNAAKSCRFNAEGGFCQRTPVSERRQGPATVGL